jgi:hypothetical protein
MAHGDYTGQRKAVLANQFAEQQTLAAQSKTLVTQVVQEQSNQVIDLFTERDYENLQTLQRSGEDGEVIVVDNPDPQFQAVKFRASEDLEQVTVGQGREFSLKGGRTYKAPKWVVEHLDSQGLVWH